MGVKQFLSAVRSNDSEVTGWCSLKVLPLHLGGDLFNCFMRTVDFGENCLTCEKVMIGSETRMWFKGL